MNRVEHFGASVGVLGHTVARLGTKVSGIKTSMRVANANVAQSRCRVQSQRQPIILIVPHGQYYIDHVTKENRLV